MGFIERFRTLCGGSRALAWLLTVTAGSALPLWIVGLAARLTGHVGDGPGLWLGVPSDITVLTSRPWTLLTYMLVHTNPLHLLFNLLWLYWFGRMLADVASDRQMLWIFVGSGVAGGVLYSVSSAFGGYTGAYLAGDSAAVLGVMAATALLMPSRRIGLFLIGEVKLKWVALAGIRLPRRAYRRRAGRRRLGSCPQGIHTPAADAYSPQPGPEGQRKGHDPGHQPQHQRLRTSRPTARQDPRLWIRIAVATRKDQTKPHLIAYRRLRGSSDSTAP